MIVLSCFVLSLFCLTNANSAPLPPKKVHRPTQTEMLNGWLDNKEPLTVAKLKKLVDWAALDTQSDAIVKAAMTRYGAVDLKEFLKLFIVDSPGPREGASVGSRRGGETHHGELEVETLPIRAEDQFSGVALETIEPYRSQIEAIRVRLGAYFIYAVNRSVNLRVYAFSNPTVYLARGETLRQTYESFIHELTHFVRFDLRSEPNPLAYETAEAFEAAYLLAPGEECDARMTGIVALIALLKKLPDYTSLPVVLEQWFTVKGEVLVKPEQILFIIRDYMGYHAIDLYRNRLEVLLMEEGDEWRALQALSPQDEKIKARTELLRADIATANRLLAKLSM